MVSGLEGYRDARCVQAFDFAPLTAEEIIALLRHYRPTNRKSSTPPTSPTATCGALLNAKGLVQRSQEAAA